MADIKRVRCEWSGSGVTGPGLSTFYFTSTATGFPADLQTFFQAIKALIPTSCTITVPNTGDVLDASTGALTGTWTDAGGSTTTGTNAGAFAGGVGISVKWLTNGIVNGRRVNGRTFICPIAGGSFETDGTPQASTVSALQTPATALITATAPDFVVWHRPQGGGGGNPNAIVSALVRDTPSWLRTRRT